MTASPRGTRKGKIKIVELQVPCYRISTLLRKHDARESDVQILTVDAESYDIQILEGAGTWGAGYLLPRMLEFEWVHVSSTAAAIAFVNGLKANHSYVCTPTPPRQHGWSAGKSEDMWCIHQAAERLPGCSDLWRKLI